MENRSERLGQIVVFNGPSSVGKSTTASAFQKLMPGPWWHTGMDAFAPLLPWDQAKRDQCGVIPFVQALHRFVADLSSHGHDVIYDTGLPEAEWAKDFEEKTQGLPVFMVGFFASRKVVAAREAARGDRQIGYSAPYHDLVHQFVTYDLKLDAEALGSEARALAIRDALAAR